jgi:hypothetical protein
MHPGACAKLPRTERAVAAILAPFPATTSTLRAHTPALTRVPTSRRPMLTCKPNTRAASACAVGGRAVAV